MLIQRENFAKLVSLALVAICAVVVTLNNSSPSNAEDSDKTPVMAPVEDDMHEFMEYAFEPYFKQLKAAVSEAPKDGKAWKPVKASSLVLAENGNLLMLRGPKENRDQWNKISAELRDQGRMLYQAARKRDYQLTRKHYEAFVVKCNACHNEFADGEHIQKP